MRMPRPVGYGLIVLSTLGILGVYDLAPRSCAAKPFYALPWSPPPANAHAR